MGGFAIEDMFLKSAAEVVPVGQVMIIFGSGGMIVFALLARAVGEPLFPRAIRQRTMLVRAAFEVTGRLFYTLAIALTALSSATAILQATPIIVVAGAALFFGEKVGWRRWSAILVGVVGVLIIIGPGTDSFAPLSILAVLGMLGFAGRDLATRAAPRGLGTFVLGVYGFAAIVVAGSGYAVLMQEAPVWPASQQIFALFGAIFIGVAAYSCLTLAMRTGEVSAVTPFRYSRLLFGIGFGVLIFGERPDSAMMIGSVIVVASGLFIMLRSQRTTS